MNEEKIKNFYIHPAIVTSGDTHERTVSLLDLLLIIPLY